MSAIQDYFTWQIKGTIWVMSCSHIAPLKLFKYTQHTHETGRYDTGPAGELVHLWVAGISLRVSTQYLKCHCVQALELHTLVHF